ncbi:acetylacetone-cleaving protein [Zavarzinia compransoris]|uniref:cupin domain-containing protein n=1 Tax=Zavarzinia marina TaxID=2911065 RepID=UPI001F227577|nr:acetylacetone-cleaving protein [Zavarzinia marina]MCF4164113.1 acetylacetone-cleaving protein [Zavarzinia marina]
MKTKAAEEYVQIDDTTFAPFPAPFAHGGVTWRLLHASPEAATWSAIFQCPAGSSFASHVHAGPGEYFLHSGRMDVRGGKAAGGETAVAPGYGFESSGSRHDHTFFPVESSFYMSFSGPLVFIDENDAVIAVIGWQEAQDAWQAHLDALKAAA